MSKLFEEFVEKYPVGTQLFWRGSGLEYQDGIIEKYNYHDRAVGIKWQSRGGRISSGYYWHLDIDLQYLTENDYKFVKPPVCLFCEASIDKKSIVCSECLLRL